MPESLIHVFIGTKAQYIKTAPLIRHLEDRKVAFRLIDSGQHAALAEDLRAELDVREPDYRLGGDQDISTIPAALKWLTGLAVRLLSRRRLQDEVFGGHSGICVVHGDTPSTLLSTLMARRVGIDVAHIEAGLRSGSLRHPFPEELIRIVVMRLSRWLFAPDTTSVANLRAMKVRGEIIALSANTNVEALARSLPELPEPDSGPVIVTSHRVENLKHPRRLNELVEFVINLGKTTTVRFVLHRPTQHALANKGLLTDLEQSDVETLPLQPHADFTRMLAGAKFVVTDGGSIQEECALLGTPTLLWRERTERSDGLGENILLSRFDKRVIADFVTNHDQYRRARKPWTAQPSAEIADVLVAELDRR